ncbi:hypothetical protein, partial [Escherichia coli]|uniref:hypothetical protein n=1 Tax=Escherichia coli TaxID=562 RepID=UPI0016497B54
RERGGEERGEGKRGEGGKEREERGRGGERRGKGGEWWEGGEGDKRKMKEEGEAEERRRE